MLKVFVKSVLNGVFEQIHLLTKSISKIPNTQFAVFQIPNTKYKKYFKYVFEIQVFQILPTFGCPFIVCHVFLLSIWLLAK